MVFLGACQSSTTETVDPLAEPATEAVPAVTAPPATEVVPPATATVPPATAVPTATVVPPLPTPTEVALDPDDVSVRLRWLRNESLDAVLRDTSLVVGILFNPDGSFRADDVIAAELRANFPEEPQLLQALEQAEGQIEGMASGAVELIEFVVEDRQAEIEFLSEQRADLAAENPDDPAIESYTTAIAIIEDEIGTLRAGDPAELLQDPAVAETAGGWHPEAPWGVFFLNQMDLDSLYPTPADESLARRGALPGMPAGDDLVAAVRSADARLAGVDQDVLELLFQAISGASGSVHFQESATDYVEPMIEHALDLGFGEQIADATAELEQAAYTDESGPVKDELRHAFGRWAIALTEQVIDPALGD